MTDIALRYHQHMLVIGPSIRAQLQLSAQDLLFALQFEPEIFADAYALQKAAGAQCLVAPSAYLTQARLAHLLGTPHTKTVATELAQAALAAASSAMPEHVLVELQPCGLPLDPTSKASLLESRAQYQQAAALFAEQDLPGFDAFFLNGFTRIADMKAALMGVQMASSAPIFASVDVNEHGVLQPLNAGAKQHTNPDSLIDALAVLADLGASVVGVRTLCTPETLPKIPALAKTVVNATTLPCLMQLAIPAKAAEENSVIKPETFFDVALSLHQEGVQFVRAAGAATPAYTTALSAALQGEAVKQQSSDCEPHIKHPQQNQQQKELPSQADIQQLRAAVQGALQK